jgi:hypothetical protein
MRTEPALHLSEDTAELYALRRLPDDMFDSVEDHAVICAECHDAVIRAADFASIMRQALQQLTQESVWCFRRSRRSTRRN